MNNFRFGIIKSPASHLGTPFIKGESRLAEPIRGRIIQQLKIVFTLALVLITVPISLFATNDHNSLPGYNLSKPDQVLILPEILHEISGITDIDYETIACVQDELGIVFIYDLKENKIKRQFDFHAEGDYEGITLIGKTMFILRSDGVLLEVEDYTAKTYRTKTYETGIPARNNEGLCHDADNNRLLIACKSKAGKGPEFKDKRAIYAFDLSSKTLSPDPVFDFSVSQIKEFALRNNLQLPVKEKKHGTESVLKFSSSAIAIHPITKKLYLLSAKDHMIFRFDGRGNLEKIEMLDAKMFNKAEGITFFPNGDMLISNEGQNGRPTLLRFNYSQREDR